MVLFIHCCAHIHSISYSFKLQYYIDPEDRWHPDYRNRRATSANTGTETRLNAESRLPAADAHTQAEEPTHSTSSSSSSVTASPELPDRSSTPAATEHADSRPTTPSQQLGDGFSVVPGPSRRLQRERPFSVPADPMWNSSRDIQPGESLGTHPPPPPYVLPPTYAEVVPSGQNEAVEVIEIQPSTPQSPTLIVQEVSLPSNNIPHLPVTEQEARNTPSYQYGPDWAFNSPRARKPRNPTTSGNGANEEIHSHVEGPDPHIGGSQVTTNTDSAPGDPSHSLDPVAPMPAEPAETSTTSENETGDVGSSSEENPNVGSQLSERARGKKRMREEDYSSDERDAAETLGELLGAGSSGGCDPSSSSSSGSDREGQPDRKRMKTDKDTDTRFSTDPLEVDEPALMMARMGFFETLTDAESFLQVRKLKELEKLYRCGRLLV